MNASELINLLESAIQEGKSAIRGNLKLMPGGGDSDKVFPSTYEGGLYAMEQRLIEGVEETTVLLDSVQSQANRMEQALLNATRDGKIQIPLLTVNFVNYSAVTSLDAPQGTA